MRNGATDDHTRHTWEALLGRRLGSTMLACAALVLLGAMATPALAASRASEARTLRGLAIREQNNSLRYLHTTWFAANYHYQTVPIASITEASGTAGRRARSSF